MISSYGSAFWVRFIPVQLKRMIFRSKDLRNVFSNTYWLFADYGIRLFVGFFVFITAARVFGPEQFGILNLALSFSMLFLPIAGLGLDQIIVRDFVREPGKEMEIAATSLIMRLVSGSISFIISCLGILIIRPHDNIMFLLVGLFSTLLIFQSFDIFDYWFQSKVQSRYVVIVKTIIFICSSILKIAALFIFSSLFIYVVICAIESGLYAMGLCILYVRKRKGFHFQFSQTRAFCMIKESYPLLLSGLFVILSMRIGQIFIGQMINEREVGIYSVATRISETTYIIIMAITASVFPIFTKIRRRSSEQYYRFLQKFFDLSGGTALGIACIVTFASGFIVRIMFGTQYMDSVRILQIHIWSTIPIFLSTAQGIWNINEGYTQINLYQAFINAFLTVLLLYILLPHYGIISAAVISVLSPIISIIVVNFFAKEARKILYMQLKPFIFIRYLSWI